MKMRVKILLGLFVYSVTIAAVLAAGSFWWLSFEFTKPGPLGESSLVTIESGSSLGTIAGRLEGEGIIVRSDVFKLSVRLLKAASDLKAGEYEIPPGASMKEVLALLREGKTYRRAVTIPEGLTSYEVLQLLASQDEVTKSMLKTIPPEGYFLPETYGYRKAEHTYLILERMEMAMFKALTELCHLKPDHQMLDLLMQEKCGDAPLKTVKDVLTLASIVEKETGKPDERARVAGVFLNRLRRGIPLQTDPTVIYALTKGEHKNEGKGPLGRRLLRKDLEIDSPYNTYKYPGLPPGPIANPGKASIEAAIHPEEHDYVFFVADGTGGHVFAKTLAEHNRNVAQWRKIRKKQKK